MKAVRLRPTFELQLDMSADEAIGRIRNVLEAPEHDGGSSSAGRTAELFVPEHDRRFWSPHLSIQVHDTESGSLLHGRFSPRPDVWTMFMFFYLLMAFIAVFGASLGYVQYVSEEPAWGFYLVGGAALSIVGLHSASLVGQRLSADQMGALRKRVLAMLTGAFGAGPDGIVADGE